MGHSVGEIVALAAAGAISLEDGLRLISARGRMMQALPSGGKMYALRIDESGAKAALEGYEDRLSIAAINGPEHIVISGDGAAADDEVAARLAENGVKSKPLNVSHAFHSPLIAPMLDEYRSVAGDISLMEPEIPIVSCVDGDVIRPGAIDASYWSRQVRDPVRFTDAMTALDGEGVSAYIEIGPHPILLGMAGLCLPYEDRLWLPSLRRDEAAWKTMLESVGKYYVQGGTFDWRRYHARIRGKRVRLPTYPFRRKKFWIDDLGGAGLDGGLEQALGPAGRYLVEDNVEGFAAHLKDAAHLSDTEAAVLPKLFQTFSKALKERGETTESEDRIHEIVWHESDRAENGPVHRTGEHWVILADGTGVGTALAEVLVTGGGQCSVVVPGETFQRQESGRFIVNPRSVYDFINLWQEAISTKGAVSGIVCLWSLDFDDQETDLDRLAAYRTVVLEGGVHLVQSVVRSNIRMTPALWFVTRGAISVTEDGDGTQISVPQTQMWGLGRVIALEHPDMWGGLIDISGDTAVESAAETLAREITAPDGEDQMVLRGTNRWAPRLAPCERVTESPLSLDPEGCYLITGGVGALGCRVAEWLVEKGARRLILTSRSGMNSAGAIRIVDLLEGRGAEVEVMAADVSSRKDMEAVFQRLASEQAALKGVIHLAGVDQRMPISEMGGDDIELVAAPKVAGAWLLHQLSRNIDLDLFICFSSMASVLGSEARGHYAAANAFLDGLAHYRQRMGLPGIAVNWGPWQEGGMASEAELMQYERLGNHGLAPDEALRLLERVIGRSHAQSIVVHIDWPAFRGVYEARRPRPMVAALGGDDVRDDAPPADKAPPWVARLRDAPANERAMALAQLMRRELVAILGLEDVNELPMDENFADMGIDSLISIEFANQIRKKMGIKESIVIYDYPNLSTLSEALLKRESFEKPEAPAAPVEEKRRIVDYDPDILDMVLDFYKTAWPNRRRQMIAPRFRWMFLESAKRMGAAPKMWIYRDSKAVIAFTGAIPVKVQVNGEGLITPWLVDTMVLESCRSLGLGPEIMIKANEELPFALSLGQTREMRTILDRLGWREVAPFETYIYPLRPHRMLKDKLNPLLIGPAGTGLQVRQYAKRLRIKGRIRALEARIVDRFDERHDVLWDSLKPHYNCAVVRDASYLNWKYVDQPGQAFIRLEMFAGGEVKAVAVLMLRDPGPHSPYLYRRAFIVDLVVSPDDPRLVLGVLETIREKCVELDADSIIFELINKKIESALEEYGFIHREPGRYFWVYMKDTFSEETRKAILSRENWLVTKGDSDIDRPEKGGP
jgi:acyl carrier protein